MYLHRIFLGIKRRNYINKGMLSFIWQCVQAYLFTFVFVKHVMYLTANKSKSTFKIEPASSRFP